MGSRSPREDLIHGGYSEQMRHAAVHLARALAVNASRTGLMQIGLAWLTRPHPIVGYLCKHVSSTQYGLDHEKRQKRVR